MSNAGLPPGLVTPEGVTDLKSRLVQWVSEMFCSHNFSWPHTGQHGRDYQVCVLCGAAYEYDWESMKRTRRLSSRPESFAATAGKQPQTLP